MRTTLLLSTLAVAHAQYRAIAKIRGSSGVDSAVSGTVIFEQPAGTDKLSDVTVTTSISGLRPGAHGFHIHQYGDVRSTSDLTTMSAHFVPYCAPPDLDGQGNPIGPSCEDDQVHGLPPSIRRQPGDMGNLTVGNDGTVSVSTRTLTIGQRKMSLADPLRSIVGRTVMIHSNPDDGTQPYGNAGPPEAYGVIGLASTAAGATNAAEAPSVPHVTKVICTFERSTSSTTNPTIDGQPASVPAGEVVGSALLTLQEPDRPNVVRMQARLQGLNSGSTHSFHFHTWGDMTVGLSGTLSPPHAHTQPTRLSCPSHITLPSPTCCTGTGLGPIYNENAIVVESLHVNAQGFGLMDQVSVQASSQAQQHSSHLLLTSLPVLRDPRSLLLATAGYYSTSADLLPYTTAQVMSPPPSPPPHVAWQTRTRRSIPWESAIVAAGYRVG